MGDCLFCGIVSGRIGADRVYEDEQVVAFRDIAPQAPVHVLVVPKRHIESLKDIDGGNSAVAARCLEVAAKLAGDLGLDGGFRLISNSGADAGQSVPHLHFHVLGGRAMGESLL
jgi:histidine triad (HIT) family protein